MTENGHTLCSVPNCNDNGPWICKSCFKHFCSLHRSLLDADVCTVCVSISNTSVTVKSLIDEDGVTHKGKHLILTGESWMRSRDVIEKMSDIELEVKLVALKTAVHEAEMVLDYRRILHSQAVNEKEGRSHRKMKRRMLLEAVDTAHKIGQSVANRVGGDSPKVEIAKDAIASLKKMGLNKDAIANVLLKLSQQKKT